MNKVWNLACESLAIASAKHPVEIQCFVLMNNHYHLMLKTPDSNLDSFMYEMNKAFSKKLRFATNLVNRMFGGRYRGTLINDEQYYYAVIRYIIQNPVRADTALNCEDYQFGSYFYFLRGIPLKFSIHFPFELDEPLRRWIKNSIPTADQETIKSGLRKNLFYLGNDRRTRKSRQLTQVNPF